MPTMMLSGFIFDLRSVPRLIEVVGRLLPPTYAVETFRICFLSGGQPVTLCGQRAGNRALDRGAICRRPESARQIAA